MFNKTKRVLALLLALVMVFALVGCGGSEEGNSSDEYEEVIQYVDEFGNPIDPDAANSDSTDADDDSDNADNNSNSDDKGNDNAQSNNDKGNDKDQSNNDKNNNDKNNNDKNNNDKNNNDKNNNDKNNNDKNNNDKNNNDKNNNDKNNNDKNNNTNNNDNSNSNLINDGVNPEDYRGTTVKFAATIHPDNDESGPVVDAFEQKYGITVEVIQSDQSNYANQLSGWIAAGSSPDVARSNGDFPMAMGYLQNLDAAKLDYNDPIWNQKTFEMTTFGGSPYLCDTVGNIWAEIDITVYSKSLLKRAGAYTPEEYDKAGNWTWDAFFEIGRQVAKVTGTTGCSVASRDHVMHAMGAPVFVLEDGKFKNGINNQAVAAMTKFAEVWKEGIINWESTNGLMDGQVGIITTHAWALKKTGFFKGWNYDDLGFYYVPRVSKDSDYGNTGQLRGWGIIRGAQNPVASGIFLREYLDSNNYDSASTFISEEAESFFYEVTSIDYDTWYPYFTYCAYTEELAGFDYMDTIYAVLGYDPAQIATKMESIKSAVDKGCKNFNDYVEKNTGLR